MTVQLPFGDEARARKLSEEAKMARLGGMLPQSFSIAAVTLILGSCSAPVSSFDFGLDHPANPRAHEAAFVPPENPFTGSVTVQPPPSGGVEPGAARGAPADSMQGGENPAASASGQQQHSGHP